MDNRLGPESMIHEAQLAERIASREPDPAVRHGWYNIARIWRSLAERAWDGLAPKPAAARPQSRAAVDYRRARHG